LPRGAPPPPPPRLFPPLLPSLNSDTPPDLERAARMLCGPMPLPKVEETGKRVQEVGRGGGREGGREGGR
jgi:hypothetical protein